MGRSGFLIALSLAVLWAIPASAYEYNSPSHRIDRDRIDERRNASFWELRGLVGELEARDAATWTTPQLERYYNKAVEYLYWHLAYSAFGGQVDYTLDSERAYHGGSHWPKDPLNDWEPLPIQDIADDPLPGGIVLQVCPVERYSDIFQHGYPSCKSFEVSIYAPVGQTPRRVKPRAGNRSWAVVRPEMLAMQGRFYPPYTLIDSPGYGMDAARERAREADWMRVKVLSWYHEHYPELPDGLNVRPDFSLDRMATIFQRDAELTALEEQYGDQPPEEWEEQDLGIWLDYELSLVYYACMACTYLEGSHRQLDYDLAALERDGFLPRIPPNLFDGGRPLRILSPEGGFSPGDICLMYPPSYWAGSNGYGMCPKMCQLFIYGGEPDAEAGQALAELLNFKDGTYYVPSGAVHTIYNYTNGYLLNSDLRQVKCES